MAGKIQVEIVGDASGLSKAFNKASKDASRFGSKVSGAIGTVAKAGVFAGVTAGIVGVTAVLKTGIGEWQQQAKVASATAAILKSTGGVANVTADQVANLAQSIMAKTGIDDEAIQSGENLLLTFKNVRNEVGAGNDVFNRATQAAVDLSSAGFGSIESASKMLGKALNDPVAGMSALSRAGVTFSATQKETIKDLIETGHTLEAQKLILGEVESQVGGVAAAYGKTLPGQINVLKEQFNNLSGSIVGAVAPAFAVGLTAVNGFIQKFSEAKGAGEKFRVVTDTIRDAAVEMGRKLLDTFRSIDWANVGRTLADGAKRGFDFLVTSIRNINWGQLGSMVGQLLTKEWNTLAQWMQRVDWNNVGHQAVQGLGRVIQAIGRFLAGVDWGATLGAFVNYLSTFLGSLGALLGGIGAELGMALLNGIRKGAAAGWGLLKVWLASLPGVIMSLFAGAGGWLVEAGKQIIMGLVRGAESQIGWAVGKLKAAGNALKGAVTGAFGVFHSPPDLMIKHGEWIIEAIAIGIQNKTPVAVREAANFGRRMMGEINKLQGVIDAVNRRREDEDQKSAVRTAQAALAEAKKKGEGVAQAERDLARAVDDIQLTARQRQLTAMQATSDKLQEQIQKANDRIKAANEKARDEEEKAFQRFQDRMDAARTRAGASFDRLADTIRKGFSAVSDSWQSEAQKRIDAITDQRAAEDLAQAVKDAKERLSDAMQGDDPGAVADAQRAVERAKQDVQLAGLEKQAEQEKAAHEKQEAAKQDNLDRMLEKLRTSFSKSGVETKAGMDALLKIINDYLGGFKGAGSALGAGFAKALRDEVSAAVSDANNIIQEKTSQAESAAKRVASGAIQAAVKLPLFDTGGIVGATGAAILHRGETVVPANRTLGNTINVTVNGFVGNDQDIAARIVNTINNGQRVGLLRIAGT